MFDFVDSISWFEEPKRFFWVGNSMAFAYTSSVYVSEKQIAVIYHAGEVSEPIYYGFHVLKDLDDRMIHKMFGYGEVEGVHLYLVYFLAKSSFFHNVNGIRKKIKFEITDPHKLVTYLYGNDLMKRETINEFFYTQSAKLIENIHSVEKVNEVSEEINESFGVKFSLRM